jgi:hypothetical protein
MPKLKKKLEPAPNFLYETAVVKWREPKYHPDGNVEGSTIEWY